jgi:hypothetical protein
MNFLPCLSTFFHFLILGCDLKSGQHSFLGLLNSTLIIGTVPPFPLMRDWRECFEFLSSLDILDLVKRINTFGLKKDKILIHHSIPFSVPFNRLFHHSVAPRCAFSFIIIISGLMLQSFPFTFNHNLHNPELFWWMRLLQKKTPLRSYNSDNLRQQMKCCYGTNRYYSWGCCLLPIDWTWTNQTST